MRTIFSLMLLVACAGDERGTVAGGGLSRDDVENIPPGDATGSAASGEYEVEMLTIACHGTCPVLHEGPFSSETCDVNQEDFADLEVTQADGAIVMNADGLIVDRLAGGIDADGSYVVGAYGTQGSGQVHVFVLGTGVLDGETFTGMSEAHAVGLYGDTVIDCTAIYELTGERR